MNKTELKKIISKALAQAQKAGKLKKIALDFDIQEPRPEFGHLATNVALIAAKKMGLNPATIAEIIITNIQKKANPFSKIEYAAGFINFTLSTATISKMLGNILKNPDWGKTNTGKGKKVLVEFISANPTGPLTLGNGRGGFAGDVLASVFNWAGYQASREYYINNVGVQVYTLGESVAYRYKELYGQKIEFPENCYQGAYIQELAQAFKQKYAKKYLQYDIVKLSQVAARFALPKMLSSLKTTIKKMGINYDIWFSEKTLYQSGEVADALKKLVAKKLIYNKDGASWFKSTKFGDDKDRVLQKADGSYTYFTSDIAYHLNKINRGFSKSIDLLGADHHGYVNRIKSSMAAFGYQDQLDVIIFQLVRLLKDGHEVRMSKRSGTYVTLLELVEEVGLDVARFIFLTKGFDTHLDFDLNLAKEHSEKNPVFYVQYAYARVSSILREVKKQKLQLPATTAKSSSLTAAEQQLIRKLNELPQLLIETTKDYSVWRLTQYATEIATSFHSFYDKNRVINPGDLNTTAQRIKICQATKLVLANVFKILGISAPEKM